MQEGVEEVNGEETQVGESLQQAFHAGVANLQHLAGVHHFTEADVHVVAVQTRIGPAQGRSTVNKKRCCQAKKRMCMLRKWSLLDHLWHRDFGVVFKGVHH